MRSMFLSRSLWEDAQERQEGGSEQEKPLRPAPRRGGRTRRRLLPARQLACSHRWLFLTSVHLPCHRRLLVTELCQQRAWAQLPCQPSRGVWTLSYRQSLSPPPCPCKMARLQSGQHVFATCVTACSRPPPPGSSHWGLQEHRCPNECQGEKVLCPFALYF